MKRIALVFTVFCSLWSFSQNEVEWHFSFDNQTNTINIQADIEDGWHLYSQNLDNDLGPIPTSFEFIPNDNYKLVGSTNEPTPIKEYDENFEGEMNFFKDEVVFTQKIDNDKPASIDGVVTYMVCNDVMCLPPVDLEFVVRISE